MSNELDKSMYFGATAQTFEKAKLLRDRLTLQEEKLWERLKQKQVGGLRFRRQHPVNTYIVDFNCHSKKLVIELDGAVHKNNRDYDLERSKDLKMYGLKVLRFWNSEVEKDIENVIEKIKSAI